MTQNRRMGRRYDLKLDLRWRLVHRKRIVGAGIGTTVDVSSTGILFDANRELISGAHIELSIAWPVLLHDVAPMQLVVMGYVVRTTGKRVAIRIMQHEFRTLKTSVDDPLPASTAAPDPVQI